MDLTLRSKPYPEVWGGVECTVNRVGDHYNDQIEWNGHSHRIGDIELFAELGIRAMRYPVLWERLAPEGRTDNIDWSWPQERLRKLKAVNIRPIVGLVHHGSGPRHTSLIHPSFAVELSIYAGKVAERFPWVEEWTPVNEPTTTARFSGLYGHWYPHARDEQSFARALVNQCRAVALSMQAIRQVNPAARLVQTDDLGKIHSTPRLRYQADFENERRWLGWDLLCGLVDRYHPLWKHLLWAGLTEHELNWFLENSCPPDVIGVNYYPTSERFIDERLDKYPVEARGGNGRDHYADVEAVRVLREGTPGVHGMLTEAWQRYKRPLAITEVHLGCTREEQMRWLLEVWTAAANLKGSGVDVRAVTAWALLGSYDWNSLVTNFSGYYEPGVFDLRAASPRPTALAQMVREMAAGQKPGHPVLATSGWWRQPQRLLYPADPGPAPKLGHLIEASLSFQSGPARPVLITGANGTLGYAMARLCHLRNLRHIALTRREMDINDLASVEAALKRYNPWAIINAAGYSDVDAAQTDEESCYRENTAGPALLATACAREGIRLVTFSSELVFNGRQTEPYVESDPCTPANIYGRSKARAEQSVLDILPAALVIRSSAFFGPWDPSNFVTRALRSIAIGEAFHAVDDVTLSPTYVPDLVHAALDLLIDGESGIWHLTNHGAVTWKQLVEIAAERAGLDSSKVQWCSLRSLKLPAPRPRYGVLGSERGSLMPDLEAALDCFLKDCGVRWSEIRPEVEHERRPDTIRAGGERRSMLRERVMPIHRHISRRR